MNKPPVKAALSILVIDDNIDDRSQCKRSLEEALGGQMHFMEAASGESGLEMLKTRLPDCVLLDYSLPGHDGVKVLKWIRALYPHLPVIMMTGQGNETIAVEAMKEGAQNYIIKCAITPETLQRAIQVAIEHSGLQKRIAEQRASLEIFTHALAHDLKEPVRTIGSFVDMITDMELLSEKSQHYFQFIHKAAARMNALIETIYLYTRLDGAEEMERKPCHITAIIEDVQENLAQLIKERAPVITCDPLPSVQANKVQMTQLFQNLIANAIKHCDKPVAIHVSAIEQEDYWQLAVRDNGPGIETEYLGKIFDPFKRLSHRKEDGPGLGLGLAINQKIVEAHGGRIWCESQVGVGTSFMFTLPKAASVAAPSAPILSVAKQPAGATQALARILLVDDNEADLMLNQFTLIENGKLHCEILTAGNGREAIVTLQTAMQEGNPIDLILLDINMPGMTGFELLAEMQKYPLLRQPLIVMCSTSAYDIDRRTAQALGAAGYLTKPPQFLLFKDIIDHCAQLQLQQEGEGYSLLRAA